jgi:hypothetical protein
VIAGIFLFNQQVLKMNLVAHVVAAATTTVQVSDTTMLNAEQLLVANHFSYKKV